ncbi:MAG: cysteine desulfurase [Gemmatimonadetes bacterium]|nr:cysteine desulfurase [Gemmatimonadota bacterium]
MAPAPIYLDHAATTPVRPEVLEAMTPYFSGRFGNASSTHRWGREARAALDEARERVARCLNAAPDEVCFTSGGTEGDNLAVLGGWRVLKTQGKRAVVSTPIEHKAVLQAVHQAQKEGAEERLLRIAGDGAVDLDDARAQISGPLALTSVMWINNETGVIQPIEELAQLTKAAGGIFHSDAVQAFGKVAIDAKAIPFDFISVSGHKFGAPKGIGAFYIRRGTPLEPLFFGGTQDRGRRPGTENVAYAVGLARAMELASDEREAHWRTLEPLRDRLEAALLARVPDALIHGTGAKRAPHICNVSVPGTDSESLLMALDLQGVAASAGSACQSGSITPSHVLSAMGVRADLASAAIRLSLGALTTPEQIDRVAELFPALILKARGLSGVA